MVNKNREEKTFEAEITLIRFEDVVLLEHTILKDLLFDVLFKNLNGFLGIFSSPYFSKNFKCSKY